MACRFGTAWSRIRRFFPVFMPRRKRPARGDFRSLDEMRSAAEQAKRIPAREAAFRLFYINQRVAGEFRFIPRAEWAACQSDFTEDSLRGQVCYAGLDLSKKNDLTALVLVFPMEEEK